MINAGQLKYYLGIILIAGLMYVPLTGKVHLFDWDEINFAESAREMIETGDYLTVQINYRAFWEKPPLYIWMQALSMKLFGVNEFAARFPNAICGIFTLLIVFSIGNKVKSERFGLFWALSMGASLLPFLYFKSGIIDPWFNLFIFLGIHNFILFYNRSRNRDILFSALFLGLAVLTKGPASLVMAGLTVFVFLFLNRFRVTIKIHQIILFLFVLAFVGGFWFILQIFNGNWEIVKDFVEYQIKLFKTKDAGHGGFLFYHFIVLLAGVFPASVFAIKSLFKRDFEHEKILDYTKWMKILFWVVLILFTIVKTKIVHYSSMCYLPLTFLSAKFLEQWVDGRNKKWVFQNILFYTLAVFFMIVGVGLPLAGLNKERIIESGIIKDDFALGNLQANVVWKGYEWISVIFLIIGVAAFIILHKKNNRIKGASWLYASMAFFTFAFLILNIKKIEGYSQRTVIDFYKSKTNEDCYIKTIRFKSYAHYFYKKQKPPENRDRYYNTEWMLNGDVDKPVYIISRVSQRGLVEKRSADDLIFMEEKNGFLFHKREPIKTDD